MPNICRLCKTEYEDPRDQACLCGQNSPWGPWHYGWAGIDVWCRFFLSRFFTRIGAAFSNSYYRKIFKPKK